MALFGKKNKEEKEETKPVATVPETSARPANLPQGEDAAGYAAILRPHQTEKAARLQALNQYTFRVRPSANQLEIKQAIARLYKVKVAGVTVAHLPAKTRRLGRQTGQRAGFKKAVVRLAPGNKIDLA